MSGPTLDLPTRPRVLVITLRRLGDVLLTTPLIRTLKAGLAGSSVEALVFRGTEGMLAGNPDLDAVHVMSQRPSPAEFLGTLWRLRRRYDLAVSSQSGDRPVVLAFAAGRRRAAFVPRAGSWKCHLLDIGLVSESESHRVPELLRIADALGLPLRPDLVCPAGSPLRTPIPAGPYAVVHVNPMFRIRQWTDAGWRELARGLAERGLAVIATGGPDPAERAYLDRVWESSATPVVRLDGRLDWPELVTLLRGAAVYVGPDTSMSHLAAAAGAPTVAIYGPEGPHRIGPWPVGGLGEPWAPAGTIQQRGNAWVVQNPLPCLPCGKLGCEGHLDSYSRCLDELPARQVLAAVDRALAVRRARAS